MQECTDNQRSKITLDCHLDVDINPLENKASNKSSQHVPVDNPPHPPPPQKGKDLVTSFGPCFGCTPKGSRQHSVLRRDLRRVLGKDSGEGFSEVF